MPNPLGPRRHNTSGYLGVSWHKSANKWTANIARNGEKFRLGLFDTKEEAHAAYLAKEVELATETPDRKALLVAEARRLYDQHGISALAMDFLNAHGVPEWKRRAVGLSHVGLLAELGLKDDYAAWRRTTFTYRGALKPAWSWERAIEVAGDLVAKHGDLPTVEWCRANGYSHLTNGVHKSGREWHELRDAVGRPLPVTRGGRPWHFESRNGLRWRSRPEASLSDFLYARGIQHRRGERYPDDYSKRSGRARGRYDLHFDTPEGQQIDVEIWGDIPDAWSRGRYSVTRKMKEAYHKGHPNFLGLHYKDCQSETRLTELLERYIGRIEPFQFDKPQDRLIETAHWSNADEVLASCRQLAASMPDGAFPNEQWLRKRGKYADRPGETYNTLAIYVTKWLGGTRNVRTLLGQSEANTIKWTDEDVIAAWNDFEGKTGFSPATAKGRCGKDHADQTVTREGAKIYEVARRHGLLGKIRGNHSGRRRKWTVERTTAEWKAFCAETGRTPTQCMSQFQRARLPKTISDRATRIYGAASRLGILDQLRCAQSAQPSGRKPRKRQQVGTSAS